jgi:hypothetical protein
MRPEIRDNSVELPPVQDLPPREACSTSELSQDHATADTLGFRPMLNPGNGWWETGWFKEWERVARPQR